MGNLRDFAVLYAARQTVIGRPVWRVKLGGSLLLTDDLRTPPTELVIPQDSGPEGEGVVLWIPLNTSAIVPSLLEPGDMLSFVANATHSHRPTLASKPAEAGKDPKELKPVPVAALSVATSETEIIGPFKILSLGNRLGSLDVMRANKMSPSNENVLGLSVKLVDGALEPKAQKLLDLMHATSSQQLGVILYPRKKK